MNFEIWYKYGSAPYVLKDISTMFKPIYQKARNDAPVVLVETQEEKEILEGFQFIYGGTLDIRIIELTSSVNPWVYNRTYLFYTFNPLERNQ